MSRRHRRFRALVSIGLAGAMVAAGLASSVAAGGGGLHGEPFRLRYRGVSPALSDLAAAPGAVGRISADAAAELEILRQHLAAKSEGEGEPTTSEWETPHGRNLNVSGAGQDLLASWEGSNHFDSRYSDNGNQFSGEPPDQGLCAGRGYVMETVNSVVQIYRENGRPLLKGQAGIDHAGAVGLSLNQVFDYPPSFQRPEGPFGPFMFDVSCYFDIATQRWFHLVDTLEQDPATGDFTGNGNLDLAVSTGPSPLGTWHLYRWATQNDGSKGTPDHRCDGGPCFADYPHIGADANGVYVTTNEYSFFGSDYNGAQLYAMSKQDLIAGRARPTALLFPNLRVRELSQKAFTLRAAQSRPSSFEGAQGGVEYFLSSTAGDGSETGNTTGGSDQLVVWALSDTSSLNGASPDPVLRHATVRTQRYVLPPLALQKPGATPLLRCINLGVDCVGDPAPFVQKGPYPLDQGDTRIMGSFFQDGVLWGTLDTGLVGRGGSDFREKNDFAPEPIGERAGIAYYALRPSWSPSLDAHVVQQGYLGVKDANLSYPSVAVGNDGHAVIGASLVGPHRYPSAVYVKVNLGAKPNTAYVAGRGRGPVDGFTGTFEGDFRPRWGDYGYAVAGRNGTVWLATNYVQQQCSFDRFLKDDTCGRTRSFFANWSTRVWQVQT